MKIEFSESQFQVSESAKSAFEQKVLSFLEEWFSPTVTVSVQTSGSTGTPKIFEIEKQKMLNSAKMTCNFLELKEGDSALICLPIEYISGKMMVVRSIERGLKLQLSEPNLNPLKNLDESIDFCAMTPLQVENSLDKIHYIQKLIIGGASVSENLKNKLLNQLSKINQQPSINNHQPTTIFETYGMSETLSHIALKQIYPINEEYFTVLDDVEISKDERGCLTIFAPKLNSEILKTNDLVEINNKIQFKFIGRIDNVINSGGAKIFPEELEAFVKKHLSNEVVFIGVPDEKLGQKLILVIQENLDTSSQENLKFKIQNLEFEKSFHKPKEIVFVESIPRTPNGKVDRIKLQKVVKTFIFNLPSSDL